MTIPSGWVLWALLSACFAALTAIFAKIGIRGVDSDLATLIRTVIILMVRHGRKNPVNHKNVTGEIPTVPHSPTMAMPKVPPSIASAKPPKPLAGDHESKNPDAS